MARTGNHLAVWLAAACMMLAGSRCENCEYWIQQESNAGGYTKMNLTGTGLQGNRSVSPCLTTG